MKNPSGMLSLNVGKLPLKMINTLVMTLGFHNSENLDHEFLGHNKELTN
jgi:hypothetical protein